MGGESLNREYMESPFGITELGGGTKEGIDACIEEGWAWWGAEEAAKLRGSGLTKVEIDDLVKLCTENGWIDEAKAAIRRYKKSGR